MQWSFYPYCGNMCDGAVLVIEVPLLDCRQTRAESLAFKRSGWPPPLPPRQTPPHHKEANIRRCYTLMISDTDLEFNKGWKPFSEDFFFFFSWGSFLLHQMKAPSFPGLKMKTRLLALL